MLKKSPGTTQDWKYQGICATCTVLEDHAENITEQVIMNYTFVVLKDTENVQISYNFNYNHILF